MTKYCELVTNMCRHDKVVGKIAFVKQTLLMIIKRNFRQN